MQKNYRKLNTVPGDNQVSKYVYLEGTSGGSPRIMFVGNSITLSGPSETIGWYGNWGMAASCKENDYVHRVMQRVQAKYPDAEFCIVQAAIWERTYRDCDYEGNFSAAKDFKPDVIICSLTANIYDGEFEHDPFLENLDKLHKYLAGGNENVKIIESTSFYAEEEKNEAIREYGKLHDVIVVEISDIVTDDSNLAIGQFEHPGVQRHPSDKGMEELARRYYAELERLI